MTPKKEPPKQESSKEPVDAKKYWIRVSLLVVLFGVLSFLCSASMKILDEAHQTNRLLSTFQRTDTVKEIGPPPGVNGGIYCYGCDNVRFSPSQPADDPQSDPNLCDNITSACPDSDGPCKQTCDLPTK